jgi:hypothetical protein
MIARHFAVRAIWDRDNEYLRPGAWLARDARETMRKRAAQRLYEDPPAGRPFVYFPLQVADDYKLICLRPECADQEALVMAVLEGLPSHLELVVKEHPMSVGRNELELLRRLARHPRITLVDPHVSSLDLARRAVAVTTISSTAGIEALMFGKPVLTLGRPFYSGYGVTLDVLDVKRTTEQVPRLADFQPDTVRIRRLLHAAMRHCYPGAPVLVDDSDKNAERLAGTLARAAEGSLGDRRFEAVAL